MDFTPNNVVLKEFDLKIGKSDIQASGTLDNILTYFSRDKIMRGNLVVNSTLLDLNEMHLNILLILQQQMTVLIRQA